MSDFATVCWLLSLGFWVGYSFRAWGEQRAARVAAAPEPHPTHAQFGTWFVEAALELKAKRKLVGQGVSITCTLTSCIERVGTFKVTVEEADALAL